MRVRIGHHAAIALSSVKDPALIDKIKKAFTIKNPKYAEAKRMGYYTGNTPAELRYWEILGDTLRVPRGAGHVIKSLAPPDSEIEVDDGCTLLNSDNALFPNVNISTRPYQDDACQAMINVRCGVLEAPTGSGKTVMALSLIAARNQKTVIIVHSKELMYQWVDRIYAFFGRGKQDINRIGDGYRGIPGKNITVAIVNSLYKMDQSAFADVGFVIVDECHRAPSRTFTEALSKFKAYYILGLSATPHRKDKLESVMHFFLGPTVHTVKKEDVELAGMKVEGRVHFSKTGFTPEVQNDEDGEPLTFGQIVAQLTGDADRNNLIVKDVFSILKYQKGTCLLLTGIKKHCEILKSLLASIFISGQVSRTEILNGNTRSKDRERIIKNLNNGVIDILISTHQLIGEGFDYDGFTSLVLTTPISYEGRVHQVVGRVTRYKKGKKAVHVRDYIDDHPFLESSARKRKHAYSKIGLQV